MILIIVILALFALILCFAGFLIGKGLDCKFKDDWQFFMNPNFRGFGEPSNKETLHIENKSK